MSQRWALRPIADPAWIATTDLSDEVEAVLRVIRQRPEVCAVLDTDDAPPDVDPGRVYLC